MPRSTTRTKRPTPARRSPFFSRPLKGVTLLDKAMRGAAAIPLEEPLCRPKHALRRFWPLPACAPGVELLQPANDVREKSFSYVERASGSCFWTAKDPSRFRGRQLNFYAYAGNDPVNALDPKGKDWTDVNSCDVVCNLVQNAACAGRCAPLAATPPAYVICQAACSTVALFACAQICHPSPNPPTPQPSPGVCRPAPACDPSIQSCLLDPNQDPNQP